MSSTTTERYEPIEINAGQTVNAVAFSANGEYLVSGDGSGVRVWGAKDGTRIATMQTGSLVWCVAVSDDGASIAAGTSGGDVCAWDANTYKQVFHHKEDSYTITGVGFSPDSARLFSISTNGKIIIFSVATHERVRTFAPGGALRAAKYSPQGDRIAMAISGGSVRVHDSNDDRLLVTVDAQVVPYYNSGLLWFDNHLFVASRSQLKRIDASTGTTVTEWTVLESGSNSCIALPRNGKFIAYSTGCAVTFWDTSTSNQLGLIERAQTTRSIAISPDDHFLAIGGDQKIIIQSLSHIHASTSEQDPQHLTSGGHDDNPSHSIQAEVGADDPISHSAFQEPDLKIDDVIFDLWKRDQLMDAEALLTAAVTATQDTGHYALANRALVRARLQEYDTALVDAEKAMEIQPSVIGYIAKSIALIGKGEKDKAYQTCDIALVPFHSSYVCFLLLFKAIITFMAGEHPNAISRIDDLVATAPFDSAYPMVQAYMYFLVGNSRVEDNDSEGAIESFRHARACPRHDYNVPVKISLEQISGWKFDDLSTSVERSLCEALHAAGRTRDAIECFHQMMNELGEKAILHGDHQEWALDFKQRCCEKLTLVGDIAADARQHEEAISHYTTALSLDPPFQQDVLIKRGKAFIAIDAWKQALDDANQVIMLDPSSPWGYEMKHASLHKGGEYDEAIGAFETMLSKMAQSPDPDVQQRGDRYISPSSTQATIRKIVQRTIRRSPRVVIDTATGRLHDKAEQASSFESLPIFKELTSSMTTRTDYVRIKREVRAHFRYVMLSHKWEENEPLFQEVMRTAVYNLEQSPTHDKLQTFCKIVRDAGFKWAWSDTCCINKSDNFVLQEALVAMFKWYQGSTLTIVFLRGVRSWSQLGALIKSIWNTRAWTLQEYIASTVIHFYTEDWTLYLDLQLPNHKKSLEVISEMEKATGVSAEQLMALRPGLTSIREKLCLASSRKTTHVEDAAYSLLGIFSVTGLPAIYGEGEGSLGRFLAHVLTGSGDVSILAWSGDSGSFNSCLPAYISVFNGPVTSHLPSSISDTEMERIVDASDSSLFDFDTALSLYDQLGALPSPWFAASRMKLPCITIQLPPLTPYRSRSGRVYQADTTAFGMVEIRTRHDLSRMKPLYLVHPWLDALLEPEDTHNNMFVEDNTAPPPSPDRDEGDIPDEEIGDDSPLVPEPESTTHPSTHVMPEVPMDRETRARRLVARLRQPFGALLVTPTGTGRRATPDYRRVASDSLITVQFREDVSLACILENVRTLDVL